MATNYGYERGKFGVFAGTIIAFPRKLTGRDPNEATWRTLVPAGYLRCDGSIKNGDDYPALKQILYTGASSKYIKSGVTLREDDENGNGGQFQLPDLGSKYIRSMPVSGGYAHLTATNPLTLNEVARVGVAATVETNIQTPVQVFYTGNLSIPSNPVPITETSNFGTTLSGITPTGYPDYSAYLPHGHYANTVSRQSVAEGANCASGGGDTSSRSQVDISDADSGTSGSFTSVTHAHNLTRSPVTRTTTQNNISTTVGPDNISTSVTLNPRNTYKMDDIQHAFILVEYLIKI
jgi:hypothetical protein